MDATRADGDSILTPDVDVASQARPADSASAQPDLTKTGATIEGSRAWSVNLTVLTVLAVLYTLYFAREFLVPIGFAILLNFLLSPVVRWLKRLRIPAPLGAAIIILAILGVLGSGAFGLSGSVRDWVANAPETMKTADAKLAKIIKPFSERVDDGRAGRVGGLRGRGGWDEFSEAGGGHRPRAEHRIARVWHDAAIGRERARGTDPPLLPPRGRRSLSSEIDQGAAQLGRQTQSRADRASNRGVDLDVSADDRRR